MDLSIIIVSWNACGFLRDCLASIRQSGGPGIREVIVVDNASTDGSADMVAAHFPEVTLIRSDENLGFARANNLGLKQAAGSLLALINSDVVIHPGSLQRLAAFLESHRDVGLVGPKVLGADNQLQRTCKRLPTVWNTFCQSVALHKAFPRCALVSGREMTHWDQEDTAVVEVLAGCFWMARRQAVEKVGDLDERFFFYAEDVDWCKRFWDAGWKVVFVSEVTTTHFGGASSANAPVRYSIELLRANLIYWRKHKGRLGEAAFYLLCVLHHTLRLVGKGLRMFAGRRSGGTSAYPLRQHLYCLRWLLTGKQA